MSTRPSIIALIRTYMERPLVVASVLSVLRRKISLSRRHELRASESVEPVGRVWYKVSTTRRV